MALITKKDIIISKKRKNRKGQNGKLLIIGGSINYPGAVTLAGLAALRTGCDWVTIACPEKVAWTINSLSPDLVTTKFKGDYLTLNHYKKLQSLIDNHTSLLIGNGTTLNSKNLIQKIIKNNPEIPKIIDADAIKSISLKYVKNAILTPHKKELELLLQNSYIDEKNIKTHINNNIIIIKGKKDKIISKQKILYNKTGNPGMTKAGTGDVLAGLCAGFLSQNYPLKQSSINGTYINGKLGEILKKEKKGHFFIASDLVIDKKHIEKILNKKRKTLTK